MNITITEKKKNPLLHRVEVTGTITFEGSTPSNSKVSTALADELKVKGNLIVVKSVNTLFSRQEAQFVAVAYENDSFKSKIEMSTKHLRKQSEAKAKKQAEEAAAKKAAEEAKVEAPVESKEEAPVEEKKEETAPAKVQEEAKAEEVAPEASEEKKEGEE